MPLPWPRRFPSPGCGLSLSCSPGLSPQPALLPHPDFSALPQACWACPSPGLLCLDAAWTHLQQDANHLSSLFCFPAGLPSTNVTPPPHQHTISLFFLQSISHHLIWIYPVIYSNTSRVDAWHALSVTHLPLLDSLLIHSRGSEILAGIMGCEMSEKDPHCLTVPVCVIWKARLVGTESRAVISRGWGGWEEGRGQLKGIKPAVRRWKVLGSNAWYPAYSQAY